jgi:hypothetical protein
MGVLVFEAKRMSNMQIHLYARASNKFHPLFFFSGYGGTQLLLVAGLGRDMSEATRCCNAISLISINGCEAFSRPCGGPVIVSELVICCCYLLFW